MFYFCVLPEFSCPPSIRTFLAMLSGRSIKMVMGVWASEISRRWWNMTLIAIFDYRNVADKCRGLCCHLLSPLGPFPDETPWQFLAGSIPDGNASKSPGESRFPQNVLWYRALRAKHSHWDYRQRHVSSLKEKLPSSNSFHLCKLAFTVDGLYLYLWY